jgi:hypothetical protein
MSHDSEKSPIPRHTLSHADIVRLAHDQKMRVEAHTDEYGRPKEGLEDHPDAIEVGGRMAVAEAQMPNQPWLQDDDEDFRRAVLDGGSFDYDD